MTTLNQAPSSEVESCLWRVDKLLSATAWEQMCKKC